MLQHFQPVVQVILSCMRRAIFAILCTFICGVHFCAGGQEGQQLPPTPGSSSPVHPALTDDQLPMHAKRDAAEQATRERERIRAYITAQALEQKKLVRETQARGYWLDSANKLMWEPQDNGTPVTWRAADRYCRDLRVAGFSDWRLATIDELATLVNTPETGLNHAGDSETVAIRLSNSGPYVRGGLTLSGNPWSSTRKINRFGKPYEDGWFFDFSTSKPSGDLPYLRNTKRALCVRQP